MLKKIALEPTEEMLRDGARRLLRFEDGSTDASFDALQWAAATNEAERVWRSMWLAATEWQCAARPWEKRDPPQECNWPCCSCDPHAAKVIEALQEQDLLKVPA